MGNVLFWVFLNHELDQLNEAAQREGISFATASITNAGHHAASAFRVCSGGGKTRSRRSGPDHANATKHSQTYYQRVCHSFFVSVFFPQKKRLKQQTNIVPSRLIRGRVAGEGMASGCEVMYTHNTKKLPSRPPPHNLQIFEIQRVCSLFLGVAICFSLGAPCAAFILFSCLANDPSGALVC